MCTIPVGVGEPGPLPGSGGEAGGPACPNCLRLEAELRELRTQLALALAAERTTLEADVFAQRRTELETRLDRQIDVRRRFTDPDNARLAKRLRKQRRHLFTFLDPGHEALEATNNRAERMLRPAVITRKTGGCNRSRTGARAHEVMASVLVTLRQQGQDVLGYLAAALLSPGLPPRLLAAPAPSSP